MLSCKGILTEISDAVVLGFFKDHLIVFFFLYYLSHNKELILMFIIKNLISFTYKSFEWCLVET